MSLEVNYLAVLVAGLVIFLLGGLWYSPAVFSKRWLALQGRAAEQMQADAANANMPVMYLSAVICGLLTSWVMALLIAHTHHSGWMNGAHLGAFAWLGFAAPTSYATYLFSIRPKALWLIDSSFNLVSFVLAGAILGAWA